MKAEREVTVWSLSDDIRSTNFADDGKFLNVPGRYLSLDFLDGNF